MPARAPSFVFPDTSVLRTFASVGELPLLKEYLHGRARVTEAVSAEIERQKHVELGLSLLEVRAWFGDPIRVEDPGEIAAVNRMRRYRFGGRANDPMKHLGESETLVVLERDEFEASLWLTDDRDAYRVAVNQRIATLHTVEILQHLIEASSLSLDDARSIYGLMVRSDRHLLQPVDVLR